MRGEHVKYRPSTHFHRMRMRITLIVGVEEGVVHASKGVVLRMRQNCPGNVCEKVGNQGWQLCCRFFADSTLTAETPESVLSPRFSRHCTVQTPCIRLKTPYGLRAYALDCQADSRI